MSEPQFMGPAPKPDPAPDLPLIAEAWDKLSRIDVGDYIERKGNFNYLSWTFAWAQLMRHYPASDFTFLPLEQREDGTVSVWVEVILSDGKRRATRQMWLPVMDNKNNAIANPNARQISDTRWRCLVKCLALFGLGLDVYAGSDMPIGSMEDPITDQQAEMLRGLIDSTGTDLAHFLEWVGAPTLEETPAKKYKQALNYLERKAKQ